MKYFQVKKVRDILSPQIRSICLKLNIVLTNHRQINIHNACIAQLGACIQSIIISLFVLNQASLSNIKFFTHNIYFHQNLEKNEKTTGKATVSNRTVYFPRYIPNSNNPCNPGNAYLSSHDYKCGNVLQNVSLGAGVASEAIIYKNKIYVGLSGTTSSGTGSGSSSSGTGSSGSGTTSLPTGWVKKDNLIELLFCQNFNYILNINMKF